MRIVVFLLFVCSYGQAQVMCGTASEGGVVTLTAPSGYKFTSIEFASYGTPNGSCSAFTTGACHAASSVSICSTAFVNRTTASVNATNAVFGDPCVGTVKRLYVQVRYDVILPLLLISFDVTNAGNKQLLFSWTTDNEVNTSEFIIEQSINGVNFLDIGEVAAGGSGANRYRFVAAVESNAYGLYYRLRMVDIDGKFLYSNILKISNPGAAGGIQVMQDLSTDAITINSRENQEAVIFNAQGQRMKRLRLQSGSTNLNIAGWQAGVYILKAKGKAIRFAKR